MYNDYPSASYSSHVDQFMALKIIIPVVILIILLIVCISAMQVFKKANRKPVTALIPFYNLIVLLEICNLPKMYFVFLLIPVVNIYFFYKLTQTLAKFFKKSSLFGFGLFILPIIYYPLLGYSKSEYIGINLVGMESKNQVSEIKVIDEIKNQEVEVKENIQEDVSTKHINISLGGGKYQKDYASNLGNVDDRSQVIVQRNEKTVQRPVQQQINNPTFIMKVEEEPKEEVKTQTASELFNVEFIPTEPKQEVKPQVDTFSEFFDCPNCGTKLKKGSKTCFICGARIE